MDFRSPLATLASTALLETVFARDIAQLDIDAVCARWKSWEQREEEVRFLFQQTPILDRVLEESQAKYLPAQALRDRLQVLKIHWENYARGSAPKSSLTRNSNACSWRPSVR